MYYNITTHIVALFLTNIRTSTKGGSCHIWSMNWGSGIPLTWFLFFGFQSQRGICHSSHMLHFSSIDFWHEWFVWPIIIRIFEQVSNIISSFRAPIWPTDSIYPSAHETYNIAVILLLWSYVRESSVTSTKEKIIVIFPSKREMVLFVSIRSRTITDDLFDAWFMNAHLTPPSLFSF